jgi:hypothetical protein
MRNSERMESQPLLGSAAEGDAPGCCRAILTLSTPGREANLIGGSSSTASPSTPALTGTSDGTGKVCDAHSRQGRPACSVDSTTAIPNTPPSMRGLVPEPAAWPSR